MNWKNLLIGLAFIIGAFLLYKMRNWGNYERDEFVVVNKLRAFKIWMVIGLTAITGIVFIVKSF